MKNNDDISTIDAAEINQLINRVKQGELDQVDAHNLFQGKVHRFSARRRTPGGLYNLHHVDVEIPADNAFNRFVVADAIYEVANWFRARAFQRPQLQWPLLCSDDQFQGLRTLHRDTAFIAKNFHVIERTRQIP